MFSIPFQLERSIVVSKPISEVFVTLADFNNWPTWSPWIIQEPNCQVTTTGEPTSLGHQQAWQGERIGSGRIELIEKQENKKLSYDLFFLAPWKSHSSTQFELDPLSSQQGKARTKIRWSMQGSLPFFLFFMKKMMTIFIGSDYERGLNMFKEYIETGTVTSSVAINKVTEQAEFYYVGITAQCHTSEIGQAFEGAFEQLKQTVTDEPDMILTLVNQFDLVNNQADMTFAFAYQQNPNLAANPILTTGYVPAHKAQSVTHTGSYCHLANGWATLMNYLRFAKLKQNKRLKEYEVYLNSPEQVPAERLLTQIFIPVK